MTDTDKAIPVNPTALVKQMNNIMPVDVHANGNDIPVVIYNERGKTYLVEVYMWDVSADPFYRPKGLFARIAERREKNDKQRNKK